MPHWEKPGLFPFGNPINLCFCPWMEFGPRPSLHSRLSTPLSMSHETYLSVLNPRVPFFDSCLQLAPPRGQLSHYYCSFIYPKVGSRSFFWVDTTCRTLYHGTDTHEQLFAFFVGWGFRRPPALLSHPSLISSACKNPACSQQVEGALAPMDIPVLHIG